MKFFKEDYLVERRALECGYVFTVNAYGKAKLDIIKECLSKFENKNIKIFQTEPTDLEGEKVFQITYPSGTLSVNKKNDLSNSIIGEINRKLPTHTVGVYFPVTVIIPVLTKDINDAENVVDYFNSEEHLRDVALALQSDYTITGYFSIEKFFKYQISDIAERIQDIKVSTSIDTKRFSTPEVIATINYYATNMRQPFPSSTVGNHIISDHHIYMGNVEVK